MRAILRWPDDMMAIGEAFLVQGTPLRDREPPVWTAELLRRKTCPIAVGVRRASYR